MGRRSPITHQALLELTQKNKFFYHHDSLYSASQRLDNYQAHRIFNAHILKNSRYFIANYAKINCLEKTGGQMEIGYRFFEGAAAGTVMLGQPPQNELFEQYFDWQNAVIPMQFHEPNIAQIIAELDSQPKLLQQIRRDNIKNSLLRHDWVYRWQTVLKQVNLSPTKKSEKRQTHLEQIAQTFT